LLHFGSKEHRQRLHMEAKVGQRQGGEKRKIRDWSGEMMPQFSESQPKAVSPGNPSEQRETRDKTQTKNKEGKREISVDPFVG